MSWHGPGYDVGHPFTYGRPQPVCRGRTLLSGIGFLQTGMESGFVLVGAGEVGMWRGARSPGETTSLAVALRPSIDRGEGDRKGQYITLKDKRGKEKTRKLPIWQTTRKQKNLKELSDVQITANGRR